MFDAPMATAAGLADLKSIRIGWGLCRVKLLEKKTPSCYRCQESGHISATCTAAEVVKKCFACRSTDHLARDCPRNRKLAVANSQEEGPTAGTSREQWQ